MKLTKKDVEYNITKSEPSYYQPASEFVVCGYERCSVNLFRPHDGGEYPMIETGICSIALLKNGKWMGATWYRKGNPKPSVYKKDDELARRLNHADIKVTYIKLKQKGTAP